MSELDQVPIDVYQEEADHIPDNNNWLISEMKQEPIKQSKQAFNDEKMLIGALICESESETVSIGELVIRMQADWFMQRQYAAAFQAIGHLVLSSKKVTTSALTLYSQLKKAYSNTAEETTDDVIANEMQATCDEWVKRTKKMNDKEKAECLYNIIDVVQDRFKQNSLMAFAKNMPKLLKTDVTDKEKFRQIKYAINVMDQSFNFNQERFQPLPKVANEILTEAVRRAQSDDKTRILGLESGFTELDEQLSGFIDGKYYIIAARPSMGKTTLALNIMFNMAVKGKKVVFFSYEMNKKQIVAKLLGLITGINPRRLLVGDLNANEWVKFNEATQKIGEYHIDIYDVQELGSKDVTLMVERCRDLHKKDKVDAVFIDYIQLMEAYDGKQRISNPVQMLSQVSNDIQFETRRLNKPFIVVGQLNREIEGRQDKQPKNSDLKGSGSLEQDADVIMFLHRPSYYDTDEKINDNGLTKVIITKNRENEKDVEISLQSDLAIGKFSNLPAINMLKES